MCALARATGLSRRIRSRQSDISTSKKKKPSDDQQEEEDRAIFHRERRSFEQSPFRTLQVSPTSL